MSGSFNALSRFGVPDRPFQPVVGQYGNSFIPQPGAGGGAVDAPMPGQPLPAQGVGAMQGGAPVYAGADPNAGFNAGPANTGAYDRGIPSPNQTWGGLMDALANAAMFALSPIGFAAGFMGTAAANPQATLVGQPALNAFGVPTATEMFTGMGPGAWSDKDGMPGEGAMFGTPEGAGGTVGTPEAIPGGLMGDITTDAAGQFGGPAPGNKGAGSFGGLGFSDDAYSGWEAVGGGPGSTVGGDMGHDSPGGAGSFRYGGYIEGEGAMPATVHGGEYVVRSEAVERYGRQTMEALNEGRIPRNALAKYAR